MSAFPLLHTRSLPPDAWLSALQDPRSKLDIYLMAYSRVRSNWTFVGRRIPDQLIYLVTERGAVGWAEGEPIMLQPGTIMWLPPMRTHTFQLPPGAPSMDVYHLRFRLQQGAVDLCPSMRQIVAVDAWSLQPYLDRLVDTYQTNLPFREQRIRALLALVCANLLDRGADPNPAGARFNPSQRKELMALINERVAERLQPGDLAAALQLTPDYFSRVFRRTYGLSPRAFLLRERIRAASQRLLETPLTISEVANELGYADLQLFSRQFKEVMGVNPREFRRRALRPTLAVGSR